MRASHGHLTNYFMDKLKNILSLSSLMQGSIDAIGSAFAGAGLYMLLESEKSTEGLVLCSLAVVLTVTRQILKQFSSKSKKK